jgi:hypothetical protein
MPFKEASMYSFDPSKIVWKELDQEVVLLDVSSGECFTLGKVGSALWKLIVEQKNDGEMIEFITSKFKVEAEQAKSDFQEFIESLLKEGILTKNTA